MKILRLIGIVIMVATLATAGALQQSSKKFYSTGAPHVTSQVTKTLPDGSITRTTTMVGSVKQINWGPTALFGTIFILGAACAIYARLQEIKALRAATAAAKKRA